MNQDHNSAHLDHTEGTAYPEDQGNDHHEGPGRAGLGAGAGLSVWATGQRQARQQRGNRYSRLSVEHPAKMLPEIARHAITTYTQPGDVVVDPMCGIGTTLVEAAHLGRRGVGIELEPKWASIARLNLETAIIQGATGEGQVHTGEGAETALRLGCSSLAGKVSLVLTSPPYGSMTHGQIRSRRDGARAVEKHAHRYSRDRDRRADNLAYQRPEKLAASFAQIMAACRTLLAPGGVVVVTTRPYRKNGELIDFPGQVAEAGRRAGMVQVDRCVALLCALRDGEVVSRTSFFQLLETRRLRKAEWPVHVIQHEDVLVFADPAPYYQQHTHGEGRAA
ncbi:site-specific DNA-methyltransferase [Nocardiopsis exhalans]|uniref:Methyltransferase n=2 Tax=Nocardiopsis TaxID=2013 RepID=A0A840WKU2_9ACTN|nr:MULTISPECIES: DNA methyltransferase [Nocardiopsis]MBB5492256.1 SAM-dependent methyltransferase [Nocardiopsis metallicus]USY18719.1 site-specific DNA-methyltransferase [Nocardiopsis exhalans]